MERFAFKIDKVLRSNLYKICRLCGIDNPDKVPILKECQANILDLEAEPELSQKIHDCIGFLIRKDDKMPQMICSLCVDKINDFYEFREMCYATNVQTRKLLGLKDAPMKSNVVKLEVKAEPSTSCVDKRGRKRKSDDTSNDAEIKIEQEKPKSGPFTNLSKKRFRLGAVPPKNAVLETEAIKTEIKNELLPDSNCKQVCNICNERFKSKYKVDRHKSLVHHPNIPRYVCTTCDVTIKKNGEIKSHQLWHKLTKTPYTCALCRDTMFSINMFTRHMRDHGQRLSTRLRVFDRQCGQCHEIFCTNFLYNTHACALRTGKCGGCNRPIKTEIDYQRHSAVCEKAYIIPSKHVTAGLENVKIKNENDVEAAAGALVQIPVENIAGSLIEKNTKLNDTELANKAQKKSNKKGMSKKDLKRVDDLLKSTMDTLVSIKHEPEIHVEADPNNHIGQHQQLDSSLDEQNDNFDNNDFHHRGDNSSDDDDNENENSPFVPIVELQTGIGIVVKQEPIDTGYVETIDKNIVNIKKELPDSGYEDCSTSTSSNGKVPLLKLKITKEHGTLNSSLVDENSACREKKKKKKKRKDTDKINEQTANADVSQGNLSNDSNISTVSKMQKPAVSTAMPQPGIIRIKQERLDNDYEESPQNSANNDKDEAMPYPEATIMTTIPMMQFQISSVSSGVEFCENDAEKDVKPNREELDRLLELNRKNVLERDSKTDSTNILKPPPFAMKRSFTVKRYETSTHKIKNTICRAKAVKSTGGLPRVNFSKIPRIISVSSGFDAIAAHNISKPVQRFAFTSVIVKPEPPDNGYESLNPESVMETSTHNDGHDDSDSNGNNNEHKMNNDEQTYIDSIDFNNINIKQEKEIDVSEPQLMEQEIPKEVYNTEEDVFMKSVPHNGNDFIQKGIGATRKDTKIDEDGDEAEDEEDEIEADEHEDNVVREYRELEWPPPLSETENDKIVVNPQALGLVISSVCSQVEEVVDNSQQNSNKPETEVSEHGVQTIELNVCENSDSLSKTSPPCSNLIISTEQSRRNSVLFENIDEEQQNILNHEVLANRELVNPSVELQVANNVTIASEATKTEEETDNFFNENVVECDQQHQQDADTSDLSAQNETQPALVQEESNINEIAENHNNANIERELLDDNITSQPIVEEPENNNEEVE